jgi:DNA-directed RNA polymerase specialized sigma24 family protein
MKKNREINPEAFEQMLLWLDENREIAGQKYEAIRIRLIKILNHRGCFQAEELTDEVIDRVIRKVGEIAENYQGNPAYYFLNVANKVYLEHSRKPVAVELPTDLAMSDDEEDFHPYYECLKKCLTTLSADKRELIVGYYEEERQAKIEFHKQLARNFGINLGNLHSTVFRLRLKLQKCVLECVGKNG